jgi:hypothetical protein
VIKPPERAWMMATLRWLKSIVPVTVTDEGSVPISP